MRVQLRLQHADLRVVERLLVFQQRLLVVPEGDDHGVELLGQLAQLVMPSLRDGHLHVEVIFPDLPDGVVERADRLEDLPAQPQAHQDADGNAEQRAHQADRIQKAQRSLGKHLRLLQDQIQPRRRMLTGGI